MLKLAIIEDHDSLRFKLIKYFAHSKKIACVLAVNSVELFLQKRTDQIDLDLILCDISLAGMSGIKGIPKIKRVLPNVSVIMMTVHQDRKNIFNAICAGADGYLLKDFTLEELENQLLSIEENKGALLSPQIARQVLNYFQPKKSRFLETPLPDKTLNEKELQIIQLLADGLTYQAAADSIGTSINSIRYYIKSIYKKLHVTSRTAMLNKFSDMKNNGKY